MGDTYFHVGDRVILHAPDGDGHVLHGEDHGTVQDVTGKMITVAWDGGGGETRHENDLVLI